METRLLQYAVEIYKQKSFTKAAHQLRIAQPSLSQQIAKLENELGVRLFLRGRSKVIPTPEGLHFLKKAEQILQLHEDLEREMLEQRESMSRDLIIGTTVITGGHVLPPLLQAFRHLYPQVQIRLVEESTAKIIELTTKGQVDLSILALPLEDAQLTTKKMLSEEILLALPRTPQPWLPLDLPLITTQPVALKHLAKAPFILLKKGFGFRQTTLELCAESGFQPHIAFETSSIHTALALAKHGLGVTLVPKMVISEGPADLLYLSLDSHPTRTLVFATQKERYQSLATQAFLQLYDQHVQEGSSH